MVLFRHNTYNATHTFINISRCVRTRFAYDLSCVFTVSVYVTIRSSNIGENAVELRHDRFTFYSFIEQLTGRRSLEPMVGG